MMSNKLTFVEELTNALIYYHYKQNNPPATPEVRRAKYDNDADFRAEVDSLLSGVIYIVGKHYND